MKTFMNGSKRQTKQTTSLADRFIWVAETGDSDSSQQCRYTDNFGDLNQIGVIATEPIIQTLDHQGSRRGPWTGSVNSTRKLTCKSPDSSPYLW